MDKIVNVIEVFDDSGFLGSFPDMRREGRSASERDIINLADRAQKFFRALFPGSDLRTEIRKLERED